MSRARPGGTSRIRKRPSGSACRLTPPPSTDTSAPGSTESVRAERTTPVMVPDCWAASGAAMKAASGSQSKARVARRSDVSIVSVLSFVVRRARTETVRAGLSAVRASGQDGRGGGRRLEEGKTPRDRALGLGGTADGERERGNRRGECGRGGRLERGAGVAGAEAVALGALAAARGRGVRVVVVPAVGCHPEMRQRSTGAPPARPSRRARGSAAGGAGPADASDEYGTAWPLASPERRTRKFLERARQQGA